MPEELLRVSHMRTDFQRSKKQTVTVVNDVSFHVNRGEIIGLVGESGCGKSVTSLSIMGLLQNTSGKVVEGEVFLKGENILNYKPNQMRETRGKDMAMIFQDPMSSLNPSMRIMNQLVEAIRLHLPLTKSLAQARALEMLKQVGIPNVEETARRYPFQLSGGMSQRVMIAMAMSCDPELLIADEPTTALDVTIQAQILKLMKKIQVENNTGIILITHDLGVVAEMCSRVLVMYAGRVVEEAPVDSLFNSPTHPYTIGLIASVPRLGSGVETLPSIPGSVPDLSNMPKGCKFAPRCPYSFDKCLEEEPSLKEVSPQQKCRCWLNDGKGVEKREWNLF